MNTDTKIVYVIADYGPTSDLAFAEVTQRLFTELGDMSVHVKEYSVPAFDTIATGFVLAQTAMNSTLGSRHLFFVNTAPRKDKKEARINNEGEGLVYARLTNGIEVVAVNSGYSLTFIKPMAEEIRAVKVPNDGTQFRSRDHYPAALGAMAHGRIESLLGADVRHTVPDRVPDPCVVYTDGYGNLKCIVDEDLLADLTGKDVTIEINGRERMVRVGTGIFDVMDGQFCFARGSSGWTLPNGKRVRFWEVVLRGGNAAKEFGHPPGGIKLSWR
ncbi:MAG: SAM-dependent chlorinase/fluorinase [Rhodospirillales bacterium]|nr:SAM-dependent chlorinase/fluorinase [Rhodospirillales bacterium]